MWTEGSKYSTLSDQEGNLKVLHPKKSECYDTPIYYPGVDV